jgi:hypothetical protein
MRLGFWLSPQRRHAAADNHAFAVVVNISDLCYSWNMTATAEHGLASVPLDADERRLETLVNTGFSPAGAESAITGILPDHEPTPAPTHPRHSRRGGRSNTPEVSGREYVPEIREPETWGPEQRAASHAAYLLGRQQYLVSREAALAARQETVPTLTAQDAIHAAALGRAEQERRSRSNE